MTSPTNRRRLSRPRHHHRHAKTLFLSPAPPGRRRVSARARLRSHQCRAVPHREHRRRAAVLQCQRRWLRGRGQPLARPAFRAPMRQTWTRCVGKSFHPQLHREWAGRESHPLNSSRRQLAALLWFLTLCVCVVACLYSILASL